MCGFFKKAVTKKEYYQPKIKSATKPVGGFSKKPSPKKQPTQPKIKSAYFHVSAFDWDGMGGNIGGLSVYVLALDIMYYPLVE